MSLLATIATVGTILAAGIVAAGIIVAIMEVLTPDDCPETPPFTYVPPKPPCKAMQQAQDIVYACWSEEVQ